MALPVADRLKALRDQHNLTQEQLAEQLGNTDRSYLSQIETGKKQPGRKFLARLQMLEEEGPTRTRPISLDDVQSLIEVALLRMDAEPTEAGYALLAPKLPSVSPRTLYLSYRGERKLPPAAISALRLLTREQSQSRVAEDAEVSAFVGRLRWVPTVSWAHMGDAVSYEELPKDWQERVPTDCEDPQAFGLTLIGDCMEPRYSPGEVAIVMPGVERRSGCLVIAKLVDDGTIFRRFHDGPGGQVRLTAYNAVYPELLLPRKAFRWIYPVHSVLKREWR